MFFILNISLKSMQA